MQNPGRPREFDPEEALSKIMQLFWENGYEATGLRDIIAVTGLGKASLYAAFGNKQSMYLQGLSHYEGLMVDAAVSALNRSDQPPMARIGMFLSSPIIAVRDHRDQRGCFLCNASADRASMDEGTSKIVQRGYEKMRRAIENALVEAQPDINPSLAAARAQLVLTVYSGLNVMARSGIAADVLSLATQQVILAIKAD
ncbi:TetR/AcrR family transcriptional regulator [Roseovarius sp. LXJ103]|uniref:TetR/AcrR family transcriptional regulator n=1 Tax=Roseovarius carneus TaxID=2853164 RepID=UPI000D612A8F|nr:TetR/AcrR family transcriptional regulator [Roseovarius carneus]MBZ8118277.1 TetR/AcrR family transcriptional regulator [Roseovarius carneus]PWE36001.1 TetR/AcrR family transcriptional regulator [Pelagicola sp. LXJ1103]